jgi:hypothetical protein
MDKFSQVSNRAFRLRTAFSAAIATCELQSNMLSATCVVACATPGAKASGVTMAIRLQINLTQPASFVFSMNPVRYHAIKESIDISFILEVMENPIVGLLYSDASLTFGITNYSGFLRFV